MKTRIILAILSVALIVSIATACNDPGNLGLSGGQNPGDGNTSQGGGNGQAETVTPPEDIPDEITIGGETYSTYRTSIEFYEYEVTDSDLEQLRYMNNLTSLSFNASNISDISVLGSFTNLTDLRLSNGQLSDISAIGNLTNLSSLVLNTSQISDISALSTLSNLDFLELRNNQISDISALSNLTNLRNLILEGNQISDISALSVLTTSLLGVNLSNNQITDLSALATLPNLVGVFLFGNPLTQEQVDELQVALPDCRIFFN